MNRGRALLFILTFTSCTNFTAYAAQSENPFVGRSGDPVEWQIAGAAPFSADDLKQCLISDLDVAAATSPTTRFIQFSTQLEDKLRAGFQHAGFPHPVVSIDRVAGEHLSIQIEPGPRFDCGDVVVGGAGSVSVERLQTLLTEKQNHASFAGGFKLDSADLKKSSLDSSDDSIPWVAGEPAAFDDQSLAALNVDVQDALARLGFFAAKFTVGVVPSNTKAVLRIRIADPGVPAVLDTIVVAGTAKNTSEQVTKLLGLELNEPFDLNLMQAAQQRLWDSGRFQRHILSAMPSTGSRGHIDLHVDVNDAVDVPPLSGALNADQTALMNVRRWMLGALNGDAAAVVNYSQQLGIYRVLWQGCLAGDGIGIRARFHLVNKPDELAQQAGVVLSPREFGIYLPTFRSKYVFPGAGHPVAVQLTLTPDVGAGKTGHSFNISAAMNTAASTRPARAFDLILSPASVIAEASNKSFIADPKLNRVGWRINGETVQFDAASGALIPDDRATATQPAALTLLNIEQHGLEHFTDEFDRGLSAVNSCDPARPFATFCTFAVVSAARLEMASRWVDPGLRERAAAVLASVVSPEVFESWQLDSAEQADQHFWIPPDLKSVGGNALQGAIAKVVLPACGKIFTYGTWPWTLGKLTGLVLAGRGDTVDAALQRLEGDPKTGPLTCLVTAKLLSLVNAGSRSAEFGRLGRQRLSADAFATEICPVLAADTRLGKSLLRIAEALRRLSPDQLHDLDAVVDANQRESFDAFVRSVQTATDDQSVRLFLNEAWSAGVGAKIDTELAKLEMP